MSKRVSPKVGMVVKVEMSGNRYNALDSDGNKLTSYIRTGTRKKAYHAGMALECREVDCCGLAGLDVGVARQRRVFRGVRGHEIVDLAQLFKEKSRLRAR